ncbi:MAG: NF038143 family protein [Desulfobacteraceae bacterium]|nr:MAG: NF038143 family protein [Desulfobacteraceae bacterium]
MRTMRNQRIILKHETKQANRIARNLLETKKAKLGWRALLLPSLLADYIRFRKRLIVIRKNLLFTKRLASNAAWEIFGGKNRVVEERLIEIKTKELLDKERKGLYVEKVRRKQLHEIELLIDHYLRLLNSNETNHANMIRGSYQSKKKYLSFLNELQQIEKEVIQVSIMSVRKGSKKDRLSWFKKVQETSNKVRMEEVERIFPEG